MIMTPYGANPSDHYDPLWGVILSDHYHPIMITQNITNMGWLPSLGIPIAITLNLSFPFSIRIWLTFPPPIRSYVINERSLSYLLCVCTVDLVWLVHCTGGSSRKSSISISLTVGYCYSQETRDALCLVPRASRLALFAQPGIILY